MNRKKRIIAGMLLISVMTLWACGSGQDMEQKETKITEQSAGEISVNAEHTGKRDNTEYTGPIDNANPKSHSEHTEHTEGTGNTDSKGHRENTGTIEGAENTGYTADQKDEEQMAGQRQLSLYLTEGYQEEWEEDFTSLCHVSWQELMLSEEEAKKYPELAEALKERNETSAGYYQEALEELLPMAREACGLDAEFFSPFFQESTLTVQRADELIVSIREDFSDYSGGVHGMYGVYGINYDTATGEVLELTDILKDITPLPWILAEKIRTVYGDEYETYESLQEDLAQEYEPEEYHWTMGYQGITFYFLPYEITSYAEGMLRVTLWFDEFPELIKEAYTMMPENGYAMAMPIGHEIDVDLNPADDRKDRIVVSSFSETEEEQTYGIEWLRIGKNDTWYKATEGYGYQFTPIWFVRKSRGRYDILFMQKLSQRMITVPFMSMI